MLSSGLDTNQRASCCDHNVVTEGYEALILRPAAAVLLLFAKGGLQCLLAGNRLAGYNSFCLNQCALAGG